MENTLTIFTPTYNRSNEIKKLYDSLEKQIDKDFVWLVVDDGSNDGTDELLEKWQKEASFKIEYIWQENAGKSMAHNLGVSKTQTELFTCVDSDDYLSSDAVVVIKEVWANHIEGDVGILALREVTRRKRNIKEQGIRTTLRNAEKVCGIKGDTMLIYKTNVLKKYSFPKFQGEKFVPENYLYDLLDRDGKLIFLDKVLYCGDYLQNGYTHNMAKVLKNNPRGYLAYIEQRISFDMELDRKCKDLIRYIAISKVANKARIIRESQYPLLTLLMYPLGLLFYCIRYLNV